MDEQFRQEIRGVFSPPTPMTKKEAEELRSEYMEAMAACDRAREAWVVAMNAADAVRKKYRDAVKELEVNDG